MPLVAYLRNVVSSVGAKRRRSLRRADKNNFAPRFGFAYQLDDAGKTVLRGGWGVYYSHYSGNIPGDLSRGLYNRRRDRGNVYSVPRHQWMNQALYELPLGKGPLLAGWQINALFNVSTGNWFTPVIADPTPRTPTRRPCVPTSRAPFRCPTR